MQLLAIYGGLLATNAAAWAWALIAFHQYPALVGSAMLAYGLGLRHAVDADHIAAIDNVTRKIMQDGRRPAAVGLFFSLGHSSVVILATAAVACATASMQSRFDSFREIGGAIGMSISSLTLLVLALMNLVVLRNIHRTWRHVRNGGAYVDGDLDRLLADRGIITRMFRSLFRLVTRSWHMYPLGMLFGLGFDTATEIALLGVAATQATNGISPWTIMVFPALFTAGMSLVDTADGHLMLGAYGWACDKPLQKLYYNMAMTLVSILFALLIGGAEAVAQAASLLRLRGPVWDAVATLYSNFSMLGYVIVSLFALAWIVSFTLYRTMRFDKAHTQLEQATAPM